MKIRRMFNGLLVLTLLLSTLLIGKPVQTKAASEPRDAQPMEEVEYSMKPMLLGEASPVGEMLAQEDAPAQPQDATDSLSLTEVSPSEGTSNVTTTITLLGQGFPTADLLTVTLGITPLVNVRVLSPTILIADMPMSTTLGTHDVGVENHLGESATLADAFDVVDFDATAVDVDYYPINDGTFTLYDMLIDMTGDHDLWGVMGGENTRIYKIDLSEAVPGTSAGREIYYEPHNGGTLTALAEDSDGHLCWTQEWFRWSGGGRIGCLTMTQVLSGTSNGVAEFPVTGSWRDTDGITYDPTSDSFWFTQRNDDEIVKLVISETVPNTSNGLYDHYLPGGGTWSNQLGPQQITADGRGNIWFLSQKSVGGSSVTDTRLWKLVIAEATPGTTDGFYSYPMPNDPHYETWNNDSIKAAPDSTIWATTDHNLYRIVPSEMVAETSQGIYVYHPPSIVGSQLEDKRLGELQFPADGKIWFVAKSSQKIVSFDPTQAISGTSRGFVEYPIPFGVDGDGKTALDNDDNFYFAGRFEDDTRVVAKYAPPAVFKVVDTDPANAAIAVPPAAHLTTTFNAPVSATTVSTRTFTVRGAQTGVYAGAYTAGSVQFDPAQDFKPGEKVVINLSDDIQSTDGISLTPYAWQFRAAPLGGSGAFNESQFFGGSDYLGEVQFADVDNDDDLDLIAAASHWHQSKIYFNDGNGDFSVSRNFGSGSDNAVSMAVGDFDNDGDLDIALGQWDDQNDIYLNDGAGNFSFHAHFDIAGYSYSMVASDVDSDGDLDLVVANQGEQSTVYRNNGNANFSKSDNLGPSNWRGRGLAVGDMDSDGDLDIVLGHSTATELPYLFLNDGSGHFPISRTVGTDLANTNSLVTGDLDGDGDLDLAIGNIKGEPSFVLFNDGTGRFPITRTFESGTDIDEIHSLALGDVDADGDLDLLASSGSWRTGQSKLHYNDGSGYFDSSWHLGGQTNTEVVAFGDIDNDGDLDIAVGRFLGARNEIYINSDSAGATPIVTDITPDYAENTQATDVTISGSDFEATPRAYLSDTALLNVTHVDTTTLEAVVPVNMDSGTYDLTVVNPGGCSGTLADAFTVDQPMAPELEYVMPRQGRNDIDVTLDIWGYSFASEVTATLSNDTITIVLTDLQRVSAGHLRGVVPTGSTSGTHDLTVANPAGEDTLAEAYTVLDASAPLDDLLATSQDVWVYTPTLRSSETAALGLRVHHQGGKQPVTTTVRFYEGNPEAGGALIGEAETPLIATRDSENTGAVSWTPDTEGSYDIYAVIDPDDLVKELPPASAENNNVLYRTFTVLPPSPDGAPPRMDDFTINDGADRTSVPDVQLDAEASEMDIPNQSGVSTIRYEEFVYNEGAEDWVLVQHSNWLDYDGFHTDYPWSMLDSPGVHYIRAWVADGASNISATPAMDFINHVPVDSTEHVAANGTNLYRRYLEAGDRLTVCVTPVNGDPDLYVWPPDWRDGAWSSVNNNLTEDLVRFEAPDSGVYQIEVYGYTAADYRLEITIDSTQTTATTSIQSVTNETATNSKTLRGAPVVDPQDTPSNQLSVPEPPTTLGGLEEIYLPLVIRN